MSNDAESKAARIFLQLQAGFHDPPVLTGIIIFCKPLCYKAFVFKGQNLAPSLCRKFSYLLRRAQT
ncbi:Hypothetical protein FKW44_022533 [Caligus rogercresseyi]|uniref:Uncharacterized protein n=1 Tax=Caligus rogercresseyi TaxID=217165 RepID=A0A7T8GMM3_CALRO|nr:Hypothetical protein FKW44_022533 [Caligus rogercresseyi]